MAAKQQRNFSESVVNILSLPSLFYDCKLSEVLLGFFFYTETQKNNTDYSVSVKLTDSNIPKLLRATGL